MVVERTAREPDVGDGGQRLVANPSLQNTPAAFQDAKRAF